MRAIVIGLAMLLAGCSEVISPNPLLIETDGRSAPVLRDGVWRLVESNCKLREDLSFNTWPDCTVWGVVAGRQASLFTRSTWPAWRSGTMIESAGEPTIVQISTQVSTVYLAMRPVRISPGGQVLEAKVWPILCGPRQEPAVHPQPVRSAGLGVRGSLFPDLVADGDLACMAPGVEPLRAAARASEPLVETLTIRWVKDQPR
jgi:hypothetical protein